MHFHGGSKAAAAEATEATAAAAAAAAPLAISTLRFVSFQLVPAAPVAFPFVCYMQPVPSALPRLASRRASPTCVFFQMATVFPAATPTPPRCAAC